MSPLGGGRDVAALSRVAEDLETRVSIVTGATGMLLEESAEAGGRTRELLGMVHDQAIALGQSLAKIAEALRADPAGLRLATDWVSVEEIVGAALNRLDADLRGHAIVTDVPCDLPLVRGDDVLLEGVLVNLLENATRFAPAGTTIAVGAALGVGEIVVTVDDEGPGIAAGGEEKVFERFFRGNPRAGTGLGLGLAICRSVVEAHGGRIAASNRPSGGASLRFTLPLAADPPRL